MAMDPATVPTLQRILASTNSFLDRLPKCAKPTAPATVSLSCTIELSTPRDITPELVSHGADPDIAAHLSASYLRRTSDLHTYIQDMLVRVRDDCSESYVTCARAQAVIDRYATLYDRQLQRLQDEAIQCVEKFQERKVLLNIPSSKAPKRKSFVSQYVPLLEFMFDRNPFPSHADKAFLAKKCGMSFRQIHVWFQNRRNRQKKGVRTNLKSGGGGLTILTLDDLLSRLGDRAIPEDLREVPVDSDVSEYEWQDNSSEDEEEPQVNWTPIFARDPPELFSFEPPSYAFPAVYPSPVRAKPQKLLAPSWVRRPAAKAPDRYTVSMDDLCVSFSALGLRECSGKRLIKKKPRSSEVLDTSVKEKTRVPRSERDMVTCATHTTVPVAPLPFLVRDAPLPDVRPIYSSASHTKMLYPSVDSQLHITQRESRPPAEIYQVPRKIAPIPQRSLQGHTPNCRTSVAPLSSRERSSSFSPPADDLRSSPSLSTSRKRRRTQAFETSSAAKAHSISSPSEGSITTSLTTSSSTSPASLDTETSSFYDWDAPNALRDNSRTSSPYSEDEMAPATPDRDCRSPSFASPMISSGALHHPASSRWNIMFDDNSSRDDFDAEVLDTSRRKGKPSSQLHYGLSSVRYDLCS